MNVKERVDSPAKRYAACQALMSLDIKFNVKFGHELVAIPPLHCRLLNILIPGTFSETQTLDIDFAGNSSV